MSSYSIKAISRVLQWIQPILNPVATPAPVRRAAQPALQVDPRLGALAQRRSASMTMAARNAVLPAVALHRPAGRATIHPLVQPQPRHSLGSEVWNSAQIARVPPATKPLRQMANAALQQRRDALVLAIKAHDMSSRTFEKAHGHREFGHEILKQEMAGYQREIARIDSLQAQRARRP